MTDGRGLGGREHDDVAAAASTSAADPRPTPGGSGARSGRPVRTVFLGSGAFAQPILRTVAAHPSLDVVAVVTAPPRPVGRRAIETPTPVEVTAREVDLPVLTPARLRDRAAVADVLALDPTLLVLADYGQIVPSDLLAMPLGALNLHPSLLPRHRGATPIPAAILAGDAETGVSLMRMDAGLDTGPLIASQRVPLSGDETAPELEARLAIVAAGLLASSLDGWLAGTLSATPQPDDGATMTRSLRREDGRLDPSLPARLLERRVRAYRPWPGTFVEADGVRLGVLGARVAPSVGDDRAGTLVPDEAGLAVATGDGRLVLVEVQPAGGRPMSGEAFLRGRPSIRGAAVVTAATGGGSAIEPAGTAPTSDEEPAAERPAGDRAAEPA